MNEKIREINDKGGKTSLQLHHEKKKTAAGKKGRYEICEKHCLTQYSVCTLEVAVWINILTTPSTDGLET